MATDTLDEAKVYDAIHNGISETDAISFKLMASVPLVSGTGLLAIFFGQDAAPIPVVSLLSLFASAITLGLFWWELRNIQTCRWLVDLARELEKRALEPLALPAAKIEPPRNPPGGVGKRNAAKAIYSTTIGAWLLLPMVMTTFWSKPYVREGLYVACALVIATETIRAIRADTNPGKGDAVKSAPPIPGDKAP
jgi:hypothetical protein